MINLSQGPDLEPGHERRLLARPVGLRAYAVVNADGGYSVMPGGLARSCYRGQCAHHLDAARWFLQDAWVLTDGPVSEFTMLKPSVGVRELVRAGII